MKNISLLVIFLFACIFLSGQNLIGYNYKEIQDYMKANHQDMNSEKVINSKFNYLKYTDSGNSQTLMFFLNQDSICTSIRLICDYSVRAEKVKEFNSIYIRNSENKWIDKRDGKDYIVEIGDEKWSCVIKIEPFK